MSKLVWASVGLIAVLALVSTIGFVPFAVLVGGGLAAFIRWVGGTRSRRSARCHAVG